MSIEYFIAKRIHFRQDKKNVSRPAVRIATIAIALGMAVMLISLAVVVGFKSEVRNKAIGFGGHIQISSIESVGNYEMQPIEPSDAFLKKTTGNFQLIPVSNRSCQLSLQTKVEFGWFFNIFITTSSFKSIMEWRFEKLLNNIKAEAEKREKLTKTSPKQ